MAACKRGLQLGFNTWSTSLAYRFQHRQISQLVKPSGKREFLVDTLALVRSVEAQDVPSKQAEAITGAITGAITEVLNDSLENVSQSVVSKGEMQKSEMLQEANLSKFKSEVKSSQEHHFSMLQRETEKLRGDIEKMRSELRYEIDKVTAGQRLDLNLERGRIRDELANQNAETTNLTNKLDRVLMDSGPASADDAQRKQDKSVPAQPRSQPQPLANQSGHSTADEYLNRFKRSSGVVASGVAKNLIRLGNHIKESLDDFIYKRK